MHLELCSEKNSLDQRGEKLISWVSALKTELNIPASMTEACVNEQTFFCAVDKLAVNAFDTTGENPHYPP